MTGRALTVDFFHMEHEQQAIVLTKVPALAFVGTGDIASLGRVIERADEILSVGCSAPIIVSLR